MTVIEPWASSMAVVEHKPPSVITIVVFNKLQLLVRNPQGQKHVDGSVGGGSVCPKS